jgi:hypothetical protein
MKARLTTYEKAKRTYNDIMSHIGCEFATIDTDLSENTEGWTLRDMVSEAQYHLERCYEEGNANADGRYIEEYMDMYGADLAEAEDVHADWLKKTRRLRAFINSYKTEALRTTCTTGHCSKFD